jgi:hypothetical protein
MKRRHVPMHASKAGADNFHPSVCAARFNPKETGTLCPLPGALALFSVQMSPALAWIHKRSSIPGEESPGNAPVFCDRTIQKTGISPGKFRTIKSKNVQEYPVIP